MNCWWLKIRSPEAWLNPANTRYNYSYSGCLMHTVMCSHIVWDLKPRKYPEKKLYFDKCDPHEANSDIGHGYFTHRLMLWRNCHTIKTWHRWNLFRRLMFWWIQTFLQLLAHSCPCEESESQHGEQRPLLLQQLTSGLHSHIGQKPPDWSGFFCCSNRADQPKYSDFFTTKRLKQWLHPEY